MAEAYLYECYQGKKLQGNPRWCGGWYWLIWRGMTLTQVVLTQPATMTTTTLVRCPVRLKLGTSWRYEVLNAHSRGQYGVTRDIRAIAGTYLTQMYLRVFVICPICTLSTRFGATRFCT